MRVDWLHDECHQKQHTVCYLIIMIKLQRSGIKMWSHNRISHLCQTILFWRNTEACLFTLTIVIIHTLVSKEQRLKIPRSLFFVTRNIHYLRHDWQGPNTSECTCGRSAPLVNTTINTYAAPSDTIYTIIHGKLEVNISHTVEGANNVSDQWTGQNVLWSPIWYTFSPPLHRIGLSDIIENNERVSELPS